MGGVKDQKITDLYAAYNADCMDVLNELPNASVHLSVYSPPFATSTGGLYTYSSNERDLSNCQTYDQFFDHYAFIVEQVARVTMPGRVSAIHCTDIPSGNTGRDYLIDFPGDIIRLHKRYGFEMIARHTIWKEPLWVRNRTMGKNLAHQTVVNDAAFAGVASSDYMLMFRKSGKNPIPIANPTGMQEYAGECPMPSDILPYKNWKGKQTENIYSHWIWRRYASGVWDDIRMHRVLPFQDCRDPEDEKHVHPLQLDVIDRTIALRSNPGEVVLTPFMGVGSEVYSAVKAGRRAIGAELKPSYYRQSIANLEVAEREIKSGRSILNHEQADMFGDLDSEAA